MLTPGTLTFNAITEAYTSILKANPGRALIYSSIAVVLIHGGRLRLALVSDGVIDLGNSIALTEQRWDALRRCWTDHASAEVSTVTANFPALLELNCKTVRTFNAADVWFEFEGDEIKDPTISECGRFSMKPSHYGFSHLSHDAWLLALPDGRSIHLNENILTLTNQTGDITARVLLSEIEFEGDLDAGEPQYSRLPETLANAAHASSGMVEYAVPSLIADAVADGVKLGLFEVISNGVALITEAGKMHEAQGAIKAEQP